MGCIKSKNEINLSIKNKTEANYKKLASSNKIKIKNLITKIEGKMVHDNYKILSKLGKGSFGSVYKVQHLQTGSIRALKVLKKSVIKYQDDEHSFLKEIEIMILLEHPNIIKIFEYYIDEINYYLITEYISGGELYDYITKKTKTFIKENARIFMKQILQAINYWHVNNIVHRDIKPENILVEDKKPKTNPRNNWMDNDNDEDIIIKWIDFGTCNYIKQNEKLTLKIGSPIYMAPEVINHNYNKKCDIWSAGVLLYITLIGHPPFEGSTIEELFSSTKRGIYDTSSDQWLKLDVHAKDLINHMLDINYTTRYSADECINHWWFSTGKKPHWSMTMESMNTVRNNVLVNIENFNAREKLQQATIAYIVHSLYDSNEINDLLKVFKEFDLNNDGCLTKDELMEAFNKYYGKNLSLIKLEELIHNIDSNDDGVISYEEFLRVAIDHNKLIDVKYLKLAFDRFDLDKDGKLSKEELRKVLYVRDNDYINKLLNVIDENQDGYLNFKEFSSLMNCVWSGKDWKANIKLYKTKSLTNEDSNNLSNDKMKSINEIKMCRQMIEDAFDCKSQFRNEKIVKKNVKKIRRRSVDIRTTIKLPGLGKM